MRCCQQSPGRFLVSSRNFRPRGPPQFTYQSDNIIKSNISRHQDISRFLSYSVHDDICLKFFCHLKVHQRAMIAQFVFSSFSLLPGLLHPDIYTRSGLTLGLIFLIKNENKVFLNLKKFFNFYNTRTYVRNKVLEDRRYLSPY